MAELGTRARPVTPGMRRVLTVAAVLVFLLGTMLYFLSGQTDRYFAWTIKAPITAAFLGAAYLASGPVVLAAARAGVWGYARVALPSVLTFTVLTLVVTLIHPDAFHFGPGHPVTARLVAWGWLAVYIVFPALAGVALFQQVRTPGLDPPRRFPLPNWFRALLAAQGVLMLPIGAGLLVLPSIAAPIWPWQLTALTARALGAWGVGIGVAIAHGLVENDWLRLRSGVGLYIGFGALGLIAMIRYADAVAWTRPSAWILVALLASLLGGGVYAAVRLRHVVEE